MPRLRLTEDARQTIDSLPPPLREAVLNAIERVAADPWVNGKPLRGRMRPLWSARIGSYRILYTIEGPESSATVVVRDVPHRARAYRRRREP